MAHAILVKYVAKDDTDWDFLECGDDWDGLVSKAGEELAWDNIRQITDVTMVSNTISDEQVKEEQAAVFGYLHMLWFKHNNK